MLEFLLYTSISCPDADALMINIRKQRNLPEEVKIELVETVKYSTPDCPWDAND